MPKALIVGAVAIVGALLTMRVFERWKSRRQRSNELDVPNPVWSSEKAKLCKDPDQTECIYVGQNAVQFLDLHRTKSFELFGCDSNGTCARDTGVTAKIGNENYTASQNDYTLADKTTIQLGSATDMIRLWTEKDYRGMYTVLQGDDQHEISNAEYNYSVCPEGYTCNFRNYYYGQDVDGSPACVDDKDIKGHRCVLNGDGTWSTPDYLSFTMVPAATV
jgi:hypothetical protein